MDEWDDGDGDVLTVENPRADRRRAAVMLGGLLLVALGLAWVLSSGSNGESGTSAPATVAGAAVTFEVRPGQTVRSVGDDLAALDVISSTLRFRRIATDVALERVLRPGRFEMTVGMGEQAAVDRLAAGPVEGLRRPTLRIQVIEGLLLTDTLATIADDLPHLEVADLEVVIAATREGTEGGLTLPDWWPDVTVAPDGVDLLEGVLWPQTYEVFTDVTARDVLQRLVDQTVSEMARVADGDVDVQGTTRSRFELMVVASLVERETNVDAERPLVAGVIHGRLRDGMRLEIDATLSYAKGDLTAIPLDVDRQSASPYNTYRIAALPPGPISGVGRASLEAAAAPEDTLFRFYVLAPACDGSHVFAVGYSEHLRNVAAFRAARDAGACR
jgi:UPF0755 protein